MNALLFYLFLKGFHFICVGWCLAPTCIHATWIVSIREYFEWMCSNEWMNVWQSRRPLSIAHILTLIRKTTNWGEYVQHIWCGFSVFKFWRKRAGKCGPYYVVDFTFNSYHLALEYKYRALRCGFKTILSLSIDIWHFHWIRVEINRFLNHHPYLIIAVFSIDSDYISCDHIEPTISHSVISSRGISKVWITANIQIFHPKTCDE